MIFKGWMTNVRLPHGSTSSFKLKPETFKLNLLSMCVRLGMPVLYNLYYYSATVSVCTTCTRTSSWAAENKT